MQLMSEMLQMQQQVISVLHSALTGGHLDVNNLARATNTRTNNTISVLHNQYQRMSIAAPIKRPMSLRTRDLPLRRPQLCQEAQRLLIEPSSTPRYKPQRLLMDPQNPARFGRECPSCESTWNDRPVGLIKDPASKLRYPSDFQFRCHTPVDDLYLCYLCGPEKEENPVLNGHAELMAHLRTHSQNDLLRPPRSSPPVSVAGPEYEASWMPKEWKGGYVEDKSLPNSPRAAFMKGYVEGKSAPPSPAPCQTSFNRSPPMDDKLVPPSPSPHFRKGSHMEDKSAPPSPTPHSRKSSYAGSVHSPAASLRKACHMRNASAGSSCHTRNTSAASSPHGSIRKSDFTAGTSAPPSHCSSLRNEGSAAGLSVPNSPTASLWGGEYVRSMTAPSSPCDGFKNGDYFGPKSTPSSPTANLWGGEYVKVKPAQSPPRTPHKCVCGAG